MAQAQLPFFPDGTTDINGNLAFEKRDDIVTYFHGHLPVFQHHVDDGKTFRLVTSQLYVNGSASQADLCRAFGVTTISLKRAVKIFREKGAAGFYAPRGSRGAAVLTPAVMEKAQQLLDEGNAVPNVAKELGIKPDTLGKAVAAGKLRKTKKKDTQSSTRDLATSSKSERNREDVQASMGMAATNSIDRVAASIGLLGEVEPVFETALDIPQGGVLFALPALLANGLLMHAKKYFTLPKGYYRLDTIFLLLAFMALARLKTVERLRYQSPGEWGMLLGLDRIPEAKTLREKIGLLSNEQQPSQWAAELCRDWMQSDPGLAGTLYIDGHTRVYHGHQTALPRHYVARQKLCLRATTDYWVNAMDGQPFFVVNQAIDPGMIKVIEQEIVPQLEQNVPKQSDDQQANPLAHRFVLVFDREGYSPDFFLRMKRLGIACQTYHKYPGEDWPHDEFFAREVSLASGHVVKMNLAERGTFLGTKLWVREIRKLCDSGHQTSVLSTNYIANDRVIASAMFARWSQENYFKYMRENYNLDGLVAYSTEDIPDTTPVVNPDYRRLDGEVRREIGKLNRRRAKFSACSLSGDIEPKKVEAYQQKQADLQQEIEQFEQIVASLKAARKQTKKHITFGELSEDDQFKRLSTQSKYLIDSIKMIAYRAETSMANVCRQTMSRSDEARNLLRAIYSTEADLLVNSENKTLTVQLHHLANHRSSITIQQLCEELTATETVFPGTELKMIYKMVSN